MPRAVRKKLCFFKRIAGSASYLYQVEKSTELGPKVTSDSRKVGQNTQILANSVLKHSWSRDLQESTKNPGETPTPQDP